MVGFGAEVGALFGGERHWLSFAVKNRCLRERTATAVYLFLPPSTSNGSIGSPFQYLPFAGHFMI